MVPEGETQNKIVFKKDFSVLIFAQTQGISTHVRRISANTGGFNSVLDVFNHLNRTLTSTIPTPWKIAFDLATRPVRGDRYQSTNDPA